MAVARGRTVNAARMSLSISKHRDLRMRLASPLARFASSGLSRCAREDSNLHGPYNRQGHGEGRRRALACGRSLTRASASAAAWAAPASYPGGRPSSAPIIARLMTSRGKAVQRAALPAPASRQRDGRRRPTPGRSSARPRPPFDPGRPLTGFALRTPPCPQLRSCCSHKRRE